ncbi:septum formation initiator family protein [Desulfuromonas sp. TF]|uniref:FtsB family cell division protein n=1 Tax=Desulfuromonas sp. TF TaxID=1232410 RepID=UPI000688A496|nr:septum formation initiator family protein [Desulfuromonas sp. TF]
MSSPSSAPRKTTVWPLLLVLLLLGMALFGDKGILRAIQFNRQKASLQAELQRMEEINSALRQEIKSLRSDRRYIEDIARRELGMVKADELVYQFPAQGKKE